MKELYKSLEKLPDSEKVVYYFDKNGNRQHKIVKVTDRYLLTNARGDSLVLTKQQLDKMNISIRETNKMIADSAEDDDPSETTTQSSPNINSGDNKNG